MNTDAPAQRRIGGVVLIVGIMAVFFGLRDDPQPGRIALGVLAIGVVGMFYSRLHPERAYAWMRRPDGQLNTLRYALFILTLAVAMYFVIGIPDAVDRWVARGSF
jgi:hypothetical protein